MSKFQDLSAYAAAISPVIDGVHVNVHASARSPYILDPDKLFLVDLRFALPHRPLSRRDLAAVYRYGDAEPDIRHQLAHGTLTEHGGLLHPTPEALAFITGLYDLHAATTERIWAGRDLLALVSLVGRVLDAAGRTPGEVFVDAAGRTSGGAFAVLAPPYEPVGTPPGVLLFNRLAALRYHRADSHAAAWQAAGLTNADIITLGPGPLRDAIEADTNRRAAQPYERLTAPEREALHAGLLALV
jgi:hypothetical protein